MNDREGGGDVILFGRADLTPIDVDKVVQRFNRDENAPVAKSLRDLGFVSAIDLLSSYAGPPRFTAWLEGAAINTDRDLRLQYLAGLGVNVNAEDQIYSELMAARRIPPGLFTGSAETLAKLHDAIASSASALYRGFRPAYVPDRAAMTVRDPEHPAAIEEKPQGN